MASKITIKRSTTATPPAGLSFGEMAFVQGTGLTANQLYVGISGGSPVWVGAQIGTTGSWTDNAAKTSLATQFAIDQRISAQISSNNPIITTDDNSNATKYLIFTSGVGSGVTLGVDVSTTSLSYNPSTAKLTVSGDVQLNGDLVSIKPTGDIFPSVVTNLTVGLAATGITMGATSGTLRLQNPTMVLGNTGSFITTKGGTANSITIQPYGNLNLSPNTTAAGAGGSLTSIIVTNTVDGAGQVRIAGGDLALGNKATSEFSSEPVNIVFEGATPDANKTTLTVVDPTANRTISLPNASDTLVGKATTDTFTNKTYDTGNTGNVFRIAGVTLSGVTGTGSVVLSTSPAITTSLIAGSTTFALLNTTATTVNFAGAATALTVGATSGSTTIRNPTLIVGTTAGTITTANGNLQLRPGVFSGYFGTLPSIAIDAAPEGAGFVNIEGGNLRLGRKTDGDIVSTPVDLVFEGATDDAFDTTLSVVDPTASRTLLLPNASDTLVGKATTDTFTNKTYDTAGTGNVFRIAGVTLSGVTGTGSVVLSTAPSLSLPRYSISATVSAAGTVQGTATALTSDINVITTATLGSATGVVLPTAVAGVRVLVRNAHATVGINVYPASGASIDNASTNVAKAMTVLQTLEFVAISSTEWQSNVRVTDSQVLRNNDFTVSDSTFNFSGTTLSAKRSYILPDADGTIALVGNKLSTFAATTSAELAGIISDETGSAGSGKLVFNTSPTITTSLVSGSTGFDLVNTTATTVNFAGAATTLNMGVLGGTATFAGALTVSGNLTVNGTTTTLNSTTLTVDDKNIEMAAIGVPDDATANGGGIIIKGTTDKTILWDSANSNLTSNQDWNLPTGKVFKINNVSVLSSSALGSGVTGSSLTQVGTITSGTWSGSFGAVSGANLTVLTAGGLTGTIPSGVLGNSSLNIGTTSIALNRTSGSQTLTGVSIDGTAGTATNVTVASETSDTTCFVTFVTADTGNLPTKVNSTLTYNAVSGELSATLIDGGSF